jgi:hypothetical protein
LQAEGWKEFWEKTKNIEVAPKEGDGKGWVEDLQNLLVLVAAIASLNSPACCLNQPRERSQC